MEGINLASASVIAAGLVNANYGLGVGLAYILGRYSFMYIDSFTPSSIPERMELIIQDVLLALLYATLHH